MGNFINFVFLLLVVQSVVSRSVVQPLTISIKTFNPVNKTQHQITSNINFWQDPTNPHYGLDDEDTPENKPTKPLTPVTNKTLSENSEIFSVFMQPISDVASHLTSILLSLKQILGSLTLKRLQNHLDKNHSLLGTNATQLFQSIFMKHLIGKRSVDTLSTFEQQLEPLNIWKTEKEDSNRLEGEVRLYKRCLASILDTVVTFLNSEINKKPTKKKPAEKETKEKEEKEKEDPAKKDSPAHESLTDTLFDILLNGVFKRSIPVPAEDKELPSDLINEIKSDNSDAHGLQYGNDFSKEKDEFPVTSNADAVTDLLQEIEN